MTDVNIITTTGGGGDNSIYTVAGAANYGSKPTFFLRSTRARIIIRFILSTIPAGSICNSAILNFYQTAALPAEATYSAYAIADANGDWVAGTADGGATQEGSSCHTYKAWSATTPVAWAGSAGLSTAGTDYINTVLASVTQSGGGNGTNLPLTFNADGLSKLASWFGGATNPGLKIVTSIDTLHYLHSSEAATAGYRPVLFVDYTEVNGKRMNGIFRINSRNQIKRIGG